MYVEPGQVSGVFVLVPVRLYRDGIVDALRRDQRFELLGSAASLDQALVELESLPCVPNVTLVDLGLPEGAGATRVLRAGWPSIAIVALAVRESDEDIVSWAEAGVAGLVSSDAALAEVLDAVEAAGRNEALTSPAVSAVLLRTVAALAGQRPATLRPALTRREREVVRLIGYGLSNKEIAHSLSIEPSTVKNHVHNILEKLSVGRRTEALSAAVVRGELSRGPTHGPLSR